MLRLSDAELYRKIGQNIKKYRIISGLTQQQLADKAQISLSYLSKIESAKCSKSMSVSVLNQLANVLNLKIETFFEGESK